MLLSGPFVWAIVMVQACSGRRLAQADQAVKPAESQIGTIEKEVDSLLARSVDTSSPAIINAYENKISNLERDKLRMQERLQNHFRPTGTMEEKLEPALQFLASSWKL